MKISPLLLHLCMLSFSIDNFTKRKDNRMGLIIGNETFTTFEDIKAESNLTETEKEEIQREVEKIGKRIEQRKNFEKYRKIY